MMNPTLPPGYAYFAYGGGMMPGSFQYGTPAIYPVSLVSEIVVFETFVSFVLHEY